MRKLLLATAAIMGASGGLAYAQTLPANPSQGQLIAPYGAGPAKDNNNNAWGVANTPSGSAAAGQLSTIFAPNTVAVPTPGTVVIRLNGRVEVEVAGTFSNLNTGVNLATKAQPLGSPNGYKLNPVGVSSYLRLYPGFDGLSANGIRYGASAEIRENFYAGTTGTVNGGSTGAFASPQGNASAQTLYVRQAFTYLATDQAGIIRLGQGSGVLSLFDNCIFTSQCWDGGLGALNGAGLGDVGPSGTQPPFVWLNTAGAEVANNKIVYLSPQFFGFDFGVQYAPSAGNAFANASGSVPFQSAPCNQAGPNCINVSSGNDATRWFNQVGGGLRYQQTFGAVDVKLYGFGETAQKENLTTGPYSTAAAQRAIARATYNGVAGSTGQGSAMALRYQNLGFYKAGGAITFANFTAALDYIGGAVNGQLNLVPEGGSNMNALLPGLTYANGPLIAGVQFGEIWSQGDARLAGVSQRHEYELALGGAYKLAPGVQLVGEYQYAYRHQNGYNFAAGTIGNTVDAQSQQVLFSTVLTW
nr:porin [uncultured Rhodopila sp.]